MAKIGHERHQTIPPDSGATLNLASLLAEEPATPGRVLRRALTENASEKGLSYQSCRELKEILTDGFLLVGTRGVWDNTTTARNMIFLALDSISDFRGPRLQYTRLLRHAAMRQLTPPELARLDSARSKMSALIYKHLLGNGEGAASAFITKHKLATLTAAPRSFLGCTDSFGALLRFALPGLIDETRPGCIRPHHIEHFHLNNRAYCKRLLLRTLAGDLGKPLEDYLRTSAQKSAEADHRHSIHRLASAIRKKILDQAGGAEHWLQAKGIVSLISRPCLNLKTASFGGLIDRFLPDVVDYRDPHALQPHEIHHGTWSDKKYARSQILRAFLSYSPKIKGVEDFYKLATSQQPIPSEVRKRAYENALEISARHFIAHGRLQSLYIRPPAFLSENTTSSLEEMARFCFQPR